MAKLYFKYGAMGSSKTAQALITKSNYEENDMKVWLLKPSADTRDGVGTIRSRIGLQAECEIATPETDIYTRYQEVYPNDCHAIIVDECQFLTMEQIDQLRAIAGTEVVAIISRRGGNSYRISMRSKNLARPVIDIARKFNGGGHAMAAGMSMDFNSFEEASNFFEREIQSLFNDEN